MSSTLVEKILGAHSGREVSPGDMVDVVIDARVARDFGGANVVKNIRDHGLGIDDASRTYFTFDTNPGGSDQRYAANQQTCRMFARECGIRVYDIDQGIGTHLAIEQGLVRPGQAFVSTDSHANIMGAIGAFGQGMGDVDIATVFATGSVWFKVPESMKIVLDGSPGPLATPKDVALAMLEVLGANGLLGYAAEISGSYIDTLGLYARTTIASMCTEMGGIILLFTPTLALLEELGMEGGEVLAADSDAVYAGTIRIDIDGLGPMIARPGHPEDVVPVERVRGVKIDSAFIGSCTNGSYSDMKAAAEILKGRKVADGVVLKIVPTTRKVWERCIDRGLIRIFADSGALVGNPGCAGCAAGQIGQNGPGEITVSTGNRNYRGKQGKGDVYLASPATVAASAIAGHITTVDRIPESPTLFRTGANTLTRAVTGKLSDEWPVPELIRGRIWYIPIDNIDTDMIYHNSHLTVTDRGEMGRYTFGNLEGYRDFAEKVSPGDIVVTGKNFGAGSSRQQAVDCFRSLGVALILAESFGSIYERNAINAGMPVMTCNAVPGDFRDGNIIEVDTRNGRITNVTRGREIIGKPFSDVQRKIMERGGLLGGGG